MIDFEKIKNLKVLLVGDAIVDEYFYVTVVGKSIKDPVISARFLKSENYQGGVSAAAKHLTTLCEKVDVMCGDRIMVNTRYVDEQYTRKLFTMHSEREGLPHEERDIADYDVVIVTDFGHGAMTPELIASISKQARFLAVSAQTNSQNYGFNLITKYPRVDYAVLDEIEARLAAHDAVSPIEDVILKLGYRKVIVTRGSKGAIGFDGAFERQPALTQTVTDTIGAGDAFLAVSAPFAATGASMKDLVRIGNAAGAVKCSIIGHRKSVTREALEEQLRAS